jgi:hypothetical protein
MRRNTTWKAKGNGMGTSIWESRNVQNVHFVGFRERKNRGFDTARGEKYILYNL